MPLIPASIRPRDPLLAAARFVLGLTIAAMALGLAGLTLGLPAVLVMHDKVAGKLVAAVLSAVALLLGILFFRHLFRIIGTVGDGDPFVPANAGRLQAMGWISVAVQVLTIPLEGVGRWLEKVTDHVNVNVDFSGSGLLMALILFILARVFREGARLRGEVEGTAAKSRGRCDAPRTGRGGNPHRGQA